MLKPGSVRRRHVMCVPLDSRAGNAHPRECCVGRGQKRGIRECRVIREDPDVLGEQRARDRAEAVEVEATAGNDLGGVAATAPAREDARDSCLIQLSCCRELEHLGRERELRGEHHVVQAA